MALEYNQLVRYPLVDENGNTVTTDTVEKNKELVNPIGGMDQIDNGDIGTCAIFEASTIILDRIYRFHLICLEDYAVRDVKSRDHDVLGNRVYGNEDPPIGEYGQKLTFSNTDIGVSV